MTNVARFGCYYYSPINILLQNNNVKQGSLIFKNSNCCYLVCNAKKRVLTPGAITNKYIMINDDNRLFRYPDDWTLE